MATFAQAARGRMTFWQKASIGLALFITLGFLQFALRGSVDIARVPAYTHVHAVVMLGWLGVTVIQPFLAEGATISLHRKLGWLGTVFAAGVCVVGIYTAQHTLAEDRQPTFFTRPYFLALTHLGILAFAGLVIAAVRYRRQTEWHRRLMLGSTVALLEPALGRVLPMPLMMPWGGWAELAVQIAVMILVVRHDHRSRGTVHPATLLVMAVLIVTHVAIEIAARMPVVERFTASLGPGLV